MGRFDSPEFAPREYEQWKKGWYSGAVLPQVETQKGNVMRTEDTPSRNGDSRNILLVVRLARKDPYGSAVPETKDMFWRVNYRPEDMTDETISRVRERAAKLKGQFPKGDPDWRPLMSFKGFRQLELLAGQELSINGNGGYDLSAIIGKLGDFYIKEGEPNAEGKVYMEIDQVATQGTKVK